MITTELCNGPQRQPHRVSPESSGSANSKAGGAGASDNQTCPRRQLTGKLTQSTSPWGEGGGLQSRRCPRRENGAPSADRTESGRAHQGSCLGTHHSHSRPEGHSPSPACLLNSKEAEPSYRKQSPGMCLL